MDIVVKRLDLVRELGLARRLAETKTTIPVYQFAHVATFDGGVTIQATNGEAALRTHCGATVDKPGEALFPVKMLHELAKNASKDDVRITHDKGRVKAACGEFASTLSTLEVSEFPNFPIVEAEVRQLPARAIGSALGRLKSIVDAGAKDTSRMFMHGALVVVSAGAVKVVATDGFRLARITIPVPELTGDDEVIVPARALGDIETLLDADDDVVTFAHDGRRATFTVCDRTYITQVIDQKFPNYERMIPKPSGTTADVDRDAWLELMRRVMLVSNERANAAVHEFSGERVQVRMQSAEVGEAIEQLPVTLSKGSKWTVAFDARFVSEFLRGAPSGVVTIDQKNSEVPALLKAGKDCDYVLMPMRL
jgi:DNA polymerase III subunit beta